MELNAPTVANEATSAESDVVTLAEHEETPVTEDISMRGSNFSGEYPFSCLNNSSRNILKHSSVNSSER